MRALDDGHYPEDPEADGWQQFWFRGRSAFRLRDDLGFLVGAGVYYRNVAMCVRAGRYGRLTPLVVDLPDGGYGETLEIVVFLADTPGESLSPCPNFLSTYVSPNGESLTEFVTHDVY